MVFNKNGIFSKAEQGTTKYGKEKSREELTLALSEVQAARYEQGLTGEIYDAKLDETINSIGQIDNDKAIVDGHIWLIDRSVPKIIDYIGEDDGIEITYTITGNDTWTKEAKTITANVTVKNNNGPLDISSIIVKKNGTDITKDVTINNNGTFALTTKDITETIFTVSAKTSKGKQVEPQTIKITPKVDTIAPTLSNEKAIAELMKIKISVNATDDKPGMGPINYSVKPATVQPSAKGTIESGKEIELTATAVGDYTVTFTTTDIANNSATATVGPVKATDTLLVADAKKIVNNMAKLKEYIGTKVDYKTGEKWQIFYFDEVGEFGPAKTLYLKKAWVANDTVMTSHLNHTPSDGGAIMKRMNPKWRDSTNATSIDLKNEHSVAWLCDPGVWKGYKNNTYSSFAIGSPSIEMYIKAYNVYLTGNKDANNLVCKIINERGYGVGTNGNYNWNSGAGTASGAVRSGPGGVFLVYGNSWFWLASPSMSGDGIVFGVRG